MKTLKISNSFTLIVIAAMTGGVYALTLFDPAFILGRSAYWIEPLGDRITNLIGALYFAHDNWRFPIFYVPGLAFPEGANIVYTDSLPLLALAAKVIFKFSGEWFNYFGWWLFFCFPLLAVFIAMATKEGGSKNIVVIFCAMLLALANPALLIRFGHAALMAHFLIAWSIYLYLRLMRFPTSRAVIVQFCIVAATSVVLQAYFLLMVMPIILAALAQVVANGQSTLRKSAMSFVTVIGAVLATAWVAGIIGAGSPSASAWGFGHYSMNVLSPFLPPRAHLPEFVSHYVNWDGNGYSVDATGGQYEGYNYLGAGILFLLFVHLFASGNIIKQALKHHLFLAVALAGLLLLALSNRIFVGSWLLFETGMPYFLGRITEHFRTGGRLFWPIYYVLVIALVLVTAKRFNPRTAVALLIVAVGFQWADTQLLRKAMVIHVRQGFAQELSRKVWKPLLGAHQMLKQYPSYQCGGWAGKWPDNNSNLELLLLAAELNIPSNSAYLARTSRNCVNELSDGLKFNIETGGLYTFGNTFPINRIESLPNFRKWCREFKHGVVCSRNSAMLPQMISQQEFIPISKKREYQFGETLQFNASGKGKHFLERGWDTPEYWGVWGLGNESEVVLRLPELPKLNLKLTVSARAFLHAGIPLKEVTVFINDKKIDIWKFKLEEGVIVKHMTIIAKDIYPLNGLIRIKFVSKEIESPKDAGISGDIRQLGLALTELTLSAVHSE